MRQRVTVVLVARNGADYLGRTLASLAAQTRQPDAVVAVDAGSTDDTSAMLAAAGPTQLVTAAAKSSFGSGIAQGVSALPPADVDNEWLWFLAHDSAPSPRALQQLLAAVEIAPSVAIAGPKIMRWDMPDMIAEFGESMTKLGAAMPLVEGELDQAQHDVSDDVLGVSAQGMLVRRSVYTAISGFDPGLPSVDAGLDFSIRARLAGHRVVLVPGARVTSAGGPEHFRRRTVTAARQTMVSRAAQLHRRLVYASAGMLAIHWLSIVPLAVVRSLGHLLAKRPGAVPGEFVAAFGAAFGRGGVGRARRTLRRTRTVGWASIAPLRLPWSEVRERRAQEREAVQLGTGQVAETRVAFGSGGGLGVTLFAAVVGLAVFSPLLGAGAISGGALLPLDTSVASLWDRVGYGWRDVGVGFVGAADPFAYVLAVLGSLTFWSPSFSLVAFFFVALPLGAAGAWFAARRLSVTPWVPTLAGVLWAVSPPLLASLTSGHIGAAIAHVLLPWLALALINASRSWPAAAGAALLMAAISASAPILAPVLAAGWLVWMLSHPRGLHRLITIPLPTVVLFAPLVVQQVLRGTPLALLADPGAPAGGGTADVGQLALGSAVDGLHGWVRMIELLGLPGAAAPFVVLWLLAPTLVVAALALFVPGSRRTVPALVIALLGFALAVVSSRVQVTTDGADPVGLWPGSGLTLLWLGLVTCVVVSLEALRRAAAPAAAMVAVTAVLTAIPLLAAPAMGLAAVAPSSPRIVPAVVAAESRSNPQIGTLIISPEEDPAGDDVGITVTLQRGLGATLDDQSTLASTGVTLSPGEDDLAELAGNLSSRSGLDPTEDFEKARIGFIVLADPADGAHTEGTDAMSDRVAEALDANENLTAVGNSSSGLLWRVTDLPDAAGRPGPGPTESAYGVAVLVTQALVFLFTLLLAVPTTHRRRRVRATGPAPDEPAPTFDEDDNV